jgi:hypothetical protein
MFSSALARRAYDQGMPSYMIVDFDTNTNVRRATHAEVSAFRAAKQTDSWATISVDGHARCYLVPATRQ